MNTEFKKISSSNNQTVYVLEDASSGVTSAGPIATMSKPLGGVRKRGQNLIAQEGNKDKVDATKPRNFVAKNAKMGGAGAHKDQKKAAKQGDVKHKNKEMDMAEGERTMSRAAKGYEKYGKKGMMALAKAGREGASDEKLDKIRDKHDHYNEGVAEGLNEFSKNKDGREEGPGDDPYKYPKPEHYSRSGDFFEKFEADHFDHEDFDDATGTFKGYWGNTQIAYFKFNNPQRTDSEDPGMGWYYEPQIEGVAEATGDERFDSMMGQITGGTGARQGVDNLNKSLTARLGSNPETALAKWGQEFIKWLENLCREFDKQGVDRFSKLEKLSEFEDGGETMAYWLIEVAKQTKTSGITLADIQEFSSEFNTYGMWPWQQFPIAWSRGEWQDYKDQWTGTNGYIANLRHRPEQGVAEEWSQKYKSSINCSHPKGFSQKAHCAGKKKHTESMMTMEAVCPDCGMCQTHGNLNEIKKGAKDSNGFTRCWPGKHAVGTKKGKNGGQVRDCRPNEGVAEDHSTATGGWGQGAYATASASSKWAGPGQDDSVQENPDWYNDEANGMTTSQLKSLIKHAAKLRHTVKAMQAQGDTLEPWQQAKVTKAADYLDAVFTAVDDDYDMGENVQPHEEDQYMAELQAKLNEKIPKNAPVERWIDDFAKAAKTPNAKGHHQFKNKNPEKIRQMAIAASYGAKNPSKKKK
jgi:hypothetical protein